MLATCVAARCSLLPQQKVMLMATAMLMAVTWRAREALPPTVLAAPLCTAVRLVVCHCPFAKGFLTAHLPGRQAQLEHVDRCAWPSSVAVS